MAVRCINCGHSLAEHIPEPQRPFAWPCHIPDCNCREFQTPEQQRAETSGVGWPD